jgi:hypothetical protein
MGLFDTLLGRTKPVRPNLDALFALPSAALTLQSAEGCMLAGNAGICWRPPAGRSVEDVQRELSELLDMPDSDTHETDPTASPSDPPLTQAEDSYGFRWLLVDDPDPETLVTRVHMINSTLSDNGWGPQLLCSVFGVVPGPDADASATSYYLVYLFKRGTFYPFAPIGHEKRDNELELHVRSVLGADLPTEPDLSRWFPLWDLPLHSPGHST